MVNRFWEVVEAVDAHVLRTVRPTPTDAFPAFMSLMPGIKLGKVAEVTAVQLKIETSSPAITPARLAGLGIDLNAGGRHGHFRWAEPTRRVALT